jgi:hypothetical protein
MRRHALAFYLATLAGALLFGCTTVHKVPQEPFTGYPDAEKIPLDIGIVKTQSLLAAAWDDGMRRGEFGTALLINTETMAEELFRSAVTVETIETGAGLGAYLVPNVKFVDSTHGMAFQDIVTTLRVEWNFTDAEGETIWLETIEGQGITKGGLGFGPRNYKVKFTERARIAVDDLFNKTYEALSTSTEIKKYATK